MDAARPQPSSQLRADLEKARVFRSAQTAAHLQKTNLPSQSTLPPAWAHTRPMAPLGSKPSPSVSTSLVNHKRQRQWQNELSLRQRQPLLAQRRHIVSPRMKKNITEALEAIGLYNKAPFILAYTLIITSVFLGIYQLIAIGILGAPNLFIESTLGQIPGLGKLINLFSNILFLPLTGLSIGIQLFIGMLQIIISLYLFHFRLTYSSFMRRYMTRRLLLAALHLFNIVPLVPLVNLFLLYQLQQTLEKKAQKAQQFLKKQNVNY